jgi:hypothetical protein
MPPESWLVVTVAAAFLLLGIAGSPLAWAALLQRRSRSERQIETRFLDLAGQVRTLHGRLERCEVSYRTHRADVPTRRSASPPERTIMGSAPFETEPPGQRRAAIHPPGRLDDPPLIAVPSLASPPPEWQAALGALEQRYAAIWTLADTGASPEVIARATGQPIGQIELILGLRRQIDGARTTIHHATHE